MEHKIDATNQSFGRLASKTAYILRGKTNLNYQPHLMPQDSVVIENILKIKFTGKKMEKKLYHRHSKYPGSIKTRTLKERWVKNPAATFKKTVLDMLPKNKLRNKIIKNLIIW